MYNKSNYLLSNKHDMEHYYMDCMCRDIKMMKETDAPMEFYQTADTKGNGIFIECFYNQDLCPEGCFDLTFCHAFKNEDGYIEFYDNYDSIPCPVYLVHAIKSAESLSDIENAMLRELKNYLSYTGISYEEAVSLKSKARAYDFICDAALVQSSYLAILESGKISKKMICDTVVPFRDKYGLDDKEALSIARKECDLCQLMAFAGLLKEEGHV